MFLCIWFGLQLCLTFSVVLQLLQKGADPNHMDRDGRTALIAAAHTGCVKTVEVLLDHKAIVNHADGDGRTALAVCILSEALKNHPGKNFGLGR